MRNTSPEGADIVLVAYGATARICKAAVDAARAEGIHGGAVAAGYPLALPGESAILRLSEKVRTDCWWWR